jgi:hypothetical protein
MGFEAVGENCLAGLLCDVPSVFLRDYSPGFGPDLV